jgi:hypothetical protein
MRKGITIVATVAVLVVTAAGLVRLRQNTARLRFEAAELRRTTAGVGRLRGENRTLHRITTEAGADAVRVQLMKARVELAGLERAAAERGGERASRAEGVGLNRDPENGPTPLEHFQNAGRGTPERAFQTIGWAALKGESAVLADALWVSGPTRQKAESLHARLPDAARSEFPTVESLVAVAVAGELLRSGSVHILGHTTVDARNAIVDISLDEGQKATRLPLRLGSAGWQLVVPEAAVDGLERQMKIVAQSERN